MTFILSDEIASAVNQKRSPLEVKDGAGRTYFVLTSEQFRQLAVVDNGLEPKQMLAVASAGDTA